MVSFQKITRSFRIRTIVFNVLGYYWFLASAPEFLPQLNGPVGLFVISLVLIFHGGHTAREDIAKLKNTTSSSQ